MSRQLRLDVAQLTDVGRKRPHNEDNMAYVIPKDEQVMARKGAFFIVADGMGGHAAGEVASEIAVDTVSSTYYQDEGDDIPLSLMNAIKRANALIHQRAAENMLRSGMGTTCVSAVLRGNIAYVANVGDSRAYLVRRGQSRQISQDHSWVEEQVRAGLLTKDQARSHAQRNVITRSLGTQAEVEVDVFSEKLEVGDTLVLCSDGLSGSINEEDLRAIINKYMPQESVYHLVERANENGGPDNITAIVVHVQELGEEVTDALYPVPVGGHVADETTAVLGRMPGSALGATPRVESARMPSAPLPPYNGSFAGGDVVSPLPDVVAPRRQRRLLFPSLAMLVLLLLALGGGGYYFWLRPATSHQDTLNTVSTLISQANAEVSSDPNGALQKLMTAQGQLNHIQQGSLTAQQKTQFSSLQSQLSSEAKVATANYNSAFNIISLPCQGSTPTALSATQTNAQPLAFATIEGGNNQTFSYILGSNNSLYLVNSQTNSIKEQAFLTGTVVLIANDAQHLYALTKLTNNNVISYKLYVVKADGSGNLSEFANGADTTIEASMIKQSIPQYIAAWGNDVYVVATASESGQNQATILDYTVNKLSTRPQVATVSISTPIVGFAAWPNKQLFFFHRDGFVRSLVFTAPTATENEVSIGNFQIATPWSIDTHTFTFATPIVSPTISSKQFLQLPVPLMAVNQSLLVSGQVDAVPHLYISDNTNHRILDFTGVTSAASSNGKKSTPTTATTNIKIGQQFASPTALPIVTSMAVNPQSSLLQLLTQTGKKPNTTSIVPIGISNQNKCAATH